MSHNENEYRGTHGNLRLGRACKAEQGQRSSNQESPSFSRGECQYSIMIDESATYDEETANAVEQIYLEFGIETRKLHLEQTRVRKYLDADVKVKYSKTEAKNYMANWKSHYDRYRNRCLQACPNIKALANILVKLGYEKYPSRDKKFMWDMAGEGIVANIKQVPNLTLPKRDPDGKFEYLGRRYSMVEVGNEEIDLEGIFDID